MVTTEAAIRALLTTGSPNAVADLVGLRVYTDALPQGVIYPAIRFERTGTERSQFRDLTGVSGYAQVTMQVEAWALTRAQALEIAQAVVGILEGFRGTAAGLRIDGTSNAAEAGDLVPDVGPGGVSVYRQQLGFLMWHPE